MACLCSCLSQRVSQRLDTQPLEDDASQILTALAQRLRTAGDPSSRVVGGFVKGLVGLRLGPDEEGATWGVGLTIDGPPRLAGGIVVVPSSGEWVGLDADGGSRLWSRPNSRRRLLHVASDGVYALLISRDERRRREHALLVDRRGRTRFEAEVSLQAGPGIGPPLVLAGLALIPFAGRRFGVVDALSGSLRSVSSLPRSALGIQRTATRAWWYDAFDWTPLLEPRRAPVSLPRRPLPPASPDAPLVVAFDPSRLLEGAGRSGYLVAQHRAVMGFDARSGDLAWVQALPSRVLAAVALPEGFAVCDEAGRVHWLGGADGVRIRRWRLMGRGDGRGLLKSCSLNAGQVPAAPPEPNAATVAPLIQQLAEVAGLEDPGLLEVRRLLYAELAARREPEATQALIALASGPTASLGLRAEARDLLARRRSGVRFMLATLATPVPLSSPSSLPPLGALADALAALRSTEAAPLLAVHLNQPGYPLSERTRAARALRSLASADQYDELLLFFDLHRAVAHADGAEAARIVAATLMRVDGARARRDLGLRRRDPLVVPQLRDVLDELLGPGVAAPASDESGSSPSQSRETAR